MKAAKKILLYFSLTLFVLIVAFGASIYLFKDKIIQQFIREANKSLNTPVKIGRIDVSAWSDFPRVAITFTDVYVEDSQPGIYPLLTAKTVSFSLNSMDALNGKYAIRGLQIVDSETHLKIDEQGRNNFTILKETSSGGEAISFDLQKVKLTNTKVFFQDLKSVLNHEFQSDRLIASVSLSDDQYHIDAKGDVTVGQIGVGSLRVLTGKGFQVDADIVYDDVKKNILINKSKLNLGESEFVVTGDYAFKEKNNINVEVKGSNTDIQTVLSLLPESSVEQWKKYESQGEIYFSLSLKGEFSATRSPLLSVSFGCKQASFFHAGYKSRIEDANMEGSFATPSLADLSRAELFLKNISGKLNNQPFTANFSMQDFEDPLVALDFKGGLDATSILNLYPVANIAAVNGIAEADISFDGRLSLLKSKSTAQQVHAEGTIDMKDISFTVKKPSLEFTQWNGTLQFNKNDIAMSNVRGRLGKSDVMLNGFLKNIVTYLLFENQPIGIEADLKSDFLDLDYLLSLGSGSKDGFEISPDLHLNFNCDVKSMRYKRFAPRSVKGDLLVKNQVAVSRHLTLDALGGSLSANAIVDAKNPKAIEVSSSFKLEGINVDSVFYVFENFYQDFIEAKHLKGEANADVSMEMTLDQKLKLYSETLTADISAVIKNGELNNFEPLQKLNRYLDDQALNQLRFADLKNDIHIEKKTIFIPQMEVHTNATNISLSGTHTFDQQIDYRVVAPLRSKKKIDPDEAFGAIEETGGQSKIFLKIVGTTSNYDIRLDKEATKKKIVSDLKKEVKELKDAFQTRGIKKKKEAELQKDEYFDWDN